MIVIGIVEDGVAKLNSVNHLLGAFNLSHLVSELHKLGLFL